MFYDEIGFESGIKVGQFVELYMSLYLNSRLVDVLGSGGLSYVLPCTAAMKVLLLFFGFEFHTRVELMQSNA